MGKEAKSEFKKNLTCTHILILWIKVFQFFIKPVCNVIHHKLFGLRWTAFNELRRCIVHILSDIIIFLVPNILQYTVCYFELPYPIFCSFLHILFLLILCFKTPFFTVIYTGFNTRPYISLFSSYPVFKISWLFHILVFNSFYNIIYLYCIVYSSLTL